VIEVDVTKIARLRDKSKATFEAREGVKLSFMPFFAVAVKPMGYCPQFSILPGHSFCGVVDFNPTPS
jgi:hypothetical protein